jgi:hypothetical protein
VNDEASIHVDAARSAAASSGGCHKVYTLKKVSSTGNMKDARASTVGMERRRHKRRGKKVPAGAARGASAEWVDSLHGYAAAAASPGTRRYNHTMHDDPGGRKQAAPCCDPSVARPQLKRVQTAPSAVHRHSVNPLLFSSQPSLVDSTIASRARTIRESLRQYEMQELALEAERAAESGMERFVGTTSRFQQPYDDFVLNDCAAVAMDRPPAIDKSGLLCRPQASASIFAKKKLRVTSLREFQHVVPPFRDMHSNLQLHFIGSGVPSKMMLQNARQRHTAESNDDEATHASNAGSSIASFSSFAMSSLRGIVDYVGSNKKGDDAGHNYNTAARVGADAGRSKASSVKYYPKLYMSTYSNENRRQNTTNLDSDDDSTIQNNPLYDGRASPSSDNGVLFGQVDYKIQNNNRQLSAEEDMSHAPTVLSQENATTQSVATFIRRMQHKFTRGGDADTEKNTHFQHRHQENAKFISNYFYTASLVNKSQKKQSGYHTISNHLKLDINPEEQKDGFCIRSGCAQNNFFSGCESMGNAMDVISGWLFHDERECYPYDHPAGRDYCATGAAATNNMVRTNSTPNMILHHGWIRNWHLEGGGGSGSCDQRRFFAPPRLSIEVDW